MTEKHVLAEQDYIQGLKYKEIADKHDVSLNTVKSWKQRHGWQRNKGAPEGNRNAVQWVTKAGRHKGVLMRYLIVCSESPFPMIQRHANYLIWLKS
ncbi:sigma factor-like helix-turn-helix DNA-binding protein [Paenibacillus sp. SC116]|uniref:sigma factor-like helix-turn-helix DNA-binding protein n=1 Tax=Paenibacillus sp. SC116 TaxID=2968986 RepID=UPI0035C753C9